MDLLQLEKSLTMKLSLAWKYNKGIKEMNIIPVTKNNLTDAARIHSISWKESHRSFCTKEFIEFHSVEHQQEYIAKKINEGSHFYMMTTELPVAVISEKDGMIEDLYVLPEYQNNGYGTGLLTYIVQTIKGRNQTPTLWILENNEGAERLYLREGFIPSGKRNSITNKLDEIEFILK